MMKKVCILIIGILLYFQQPLFASFELKGYGARARGMGHAYTGLANTPDAIFTNPAGMAQLNTGAVSFLYLCPFGIKELAYYSFAGVMPTPWGNLSTGISSFGNQLYQEQSVLLNFSHKISGNIFLGLNIHYMKLQITQYGSDFSFGFDLGFLIHLSPLLNWGFYSNNINRASLGKSGNDYLPQVFSTGFSLFPIKNLIFNVDVYKELPFPLEVRAGFEYLFARKIAIRSGFITNPSQFCLGLGFLFKYFRCDYAINTHPDLGLTHQISVQLNLKNK